jgi:very-short-patch-repair endonuclease/DNA polymerase III delta prime subunit
MGAQNENVATRRATQIFQYLRALNELRNPVVRHIQDQVEHLWLRELPEHEAVQVRGPDPEGEGSEDGFALTVVRADRTPPPEPPTAIRPWLGSQWEDPYGHPGLHSPRIVEEESDPRRTSIWREDVEQRATWFIEWKRRWEAWTAWIADWETWAATERPARAAREMFEALYELHGRLEREAERIELVLGDGLLNWDVEEGGVHHPMMLRKLQLSFDPEVPKFDIVETERETELYSALFRVLPSVRGDDVAGIREEIEGENHHPLGSEDTSRFLRSLTHTLSSEGEYVGHGRVRGAEEHPRVARDPVIFVRRRVLGFATAVDGILERIESGESIPDSLRYIVGLQGMDHSNDGDDDSGDPEILLSKPANEEQRRVAERLEEHGAVVVQGPPGTGKTHTIANLIGHLLSEGKRVLVSSHTSKALRRVRDQVVEPLRSLCVSVLGSDVQSREELKNAVNSMANRLSEYDVDKLREEASQLKRALDEVTADLEEAKAALRQARRSEYDDVVVGEQTYHPTVAARQVRRGTGRHDWIPEPVDQDASLRLSSADLSELYRTNTQLSEAEEKQVAASLPDLDTIPTPDTLDEKMAARQRLDDRAQPDVDDDPRLWADDADEASLDDLEEIQDELNEVVQTIEDLESWEAEALLAGSQGKGRRKPWERLLTVLDETVQCANEIEETLIEHDPKLPDDPDESTLIRVLDEMIAHLRRGGGLGFWARLWHPEWTRVINDSRVHNNTLPQTRNEFEALRNKAQLRALRKRLVNRWDRLVHRHGGVEAAMLGDEPERILHQYHSTIENHLSWHEETWRPLRDRLQDVGLQWDEIYRRTDPEVERHGRLHRLSEACAQVILLLEERIIRKRRAPLESWFEEHDERLRHQADDAESRVIDDLASSFSDRDVDAYEAAYQTCVELHRLRDVLHRRQALLEDLEADAPNWARHVRERIPPHDEGTLPGDPEHAWTWCQLHQELERRAERSIDAIQQQIDQYEQDIQHTTQQLIKNRAWAAQIQRIQEDQSRRQALVGWVDTMRKIGRGYGKRVPELRREARRQMKKCRDAVPVWIMPLALAVQNFDARTTQFDVVIVDEASQVDVMGLVLLAMTKQVVIVGDHEQVSPSAVGQRVDDVRYLIQEHLQEIPNNKLYDGETSIYDLARQSFGEIIGLREHFRCVPEIIQFSNALAYNFEIKPLRDAANVELNPHVIGHRVHGASSEDKVNEREARRVASLVHAATEHPAYEDKTFGIISLVGERQSELIEKLLREHMDPVAYNEHRVMAGNPAQFQGDERDVTFLSVVDAPREEGRLPRRAEQLFRQRFNVAASRARDQMWVVHSLDPRSDLKEGDLRRRLIEHANDPSVLMRLADQGASEAESEFEQRVVRRLTAKGYHVVPQWEVGAYRIDLVVQGPDGKKLAVECDGTRFHPVEKLEEDMERQAILGRLGWTFVRIRGSVFFRDPDRAMRDVFERLDDMGIEPWQPDAPGEMQEAPTGYSDLHSHVARRAAELRQGWGWTDGKIEVELDRSDEARPMSAEGTPGDDNGSHRDDAEGSGRSKGASPAEGGARRGDASAVDEDEVRSELRIETTGDGVRLDLDEYDFERIEDIPESALTRVVARHVPTTGALQREVLVERVAKTLALALTRRRTGRLSKRRLRRRIHTHVRRLTDANQLQVLRDGEQIRRGSR